MTSLLTFLKMKPVRWTLIGVGTSLVGIPVIFASFPYMFPETRAKAGSFFDVVEIKEISNLSVQRLNFSKVVTATHPKGSSVSNATVFVRRIMRGHVTSSMDFSKVSITNINGKLVVKFPKLVTEPFIDEWIFYDSKGTKKDPREMTRTMDQAFRDDMMKAASQTGRVARAKEQAVRIVKTLYPDLEFEPRWPDEKKEAQSEEGGGANE